jgi:hypothetical protein
MSGVIWQNYAQSFHGSEGTAKGDTLLGYCSAALLRLPILF